MRKKVLFLCTGNSARSQMAEALLRSFGGTHFEAYSAGTQPTGLNPLTVQAMKELDLDVKEHRSKHVNDVAGQRFDYVITVCDRARETCPVFHGARNIHWSFEDPVAAPPEEQLTLFRRVRAEITASIRDFVMKETVVIP